MGSNPIQRTPPKPIDPFISNIPIQERFDELEAAIHTLLPEVPEDDRDMAVRWLASRLMNGPPANRIPA